MARASACCQAHAGMSIVDTRARLSQSEIPGGALAGGCTSGSVAFSERIARVHWLSHSCQLLVVVEQWAAAAGEQATRQAPIPVGVCRVALNERSTLEHQLPGDSREGFDAAHGLKSISRVYLLGRARSYDDQQWNALIHVENPTFWVGGHARSHSERRIDFDGRVLKWLSHDRAASVSEDQPLPSQNGECLLHRADTDLIVVLQLRLCGKPAPRA